MTEAAFQVRFWGVRGSIPVSGPEYIRYGGNSPCIELCCGNKRIVLDGGSGLRPCGKALMRSKLWSSESRVARSAQPSISEVIHEQTGQGTPESQEAVEARYKTQL